MGAELTAGTARASREELEREMKEDGLDPRWWSSAPGDVYEAHEHSYHKVLHCFSGSIAFHTDGGEIEMDAGDRLDLEPGTSHSATVGPQGVVCVESPR